MKIGIFTRTILKCILVFLARSPSAEASEGGRARVEGERRELDTVASSE
jgi:hypothetical protein